MAGCEPVFGDLVLGAGRGGEGVSSVSLIYIRKKKGGRGCFLGYMVYGMWYTVYGFFFFFSFTILEGTGREIIYMLTSRPRPRRARIRLHVFRHRSMKRASSASWGTRDLGSSCWGLLSLNSPKFIALG